MRRCLTAALLIIMALPSTAQEREKEISVSWGMIPGPIYDFEMLWSGDTGNLSYIYKDYMDKSITTGLISADFTIQCGRRFAFGIQANAAACMNTEMSAITSDVLNKFTDFTISALAYSKYTYLRKEYVKLYTTLGFGIKYHHFGYPVSSYPDGPESGFTPGVHYSPFGITVGKKIYCLAELGVGSELMGIRFGIGCRFH